MIILIENIVGVLALSFSASIIIFGVVDLYKIEKQFRAEMKKIKEDDEAINRYFLEQRRNRHREVHVWVSGEN